MDAAVRLFWDLLAMAKVDLVEWAFAVQVVVVQDVVVDVDDVVVDRVEVVVPVVDVEVVVVHVKVVVTEHSVMDLVVVGS